MVTPSSDSPVAGGSFTLTCDHGSTASNPTYQWFDNAGTVIGTQATFTLNPLRESHSGEYSCLITDQSDGLVGCGVHRVSVQGKLTISYRMSMYIIMWDNIIVCISDLAPTVIVSIEGLDRGTVGRSQTLTCFVSGVDLGEVSVRYTWLRDGTLVQSAVRLNQYTIPSGSLGVRNAGDVYTCQVAITASYWDVSGSFGNSGSGTLTIISKLITNNNLYFLSIILSNNLVPNPDVLITELTFVPAEYVGLNYTLQCEAVSQLEDIEAVMEWMKNGIILSNSSNGRITLVETIVDSPGRDFRRSIMFSPLSASDMGSYSCSATISPTVANSRITNSVGIGSSNLTVIGKP